MSLYREEILDHYKHPRNFGAMPDASAHAEESNIPCGDRLRVHLKFDGGNIADIKFEGSGCALSIAAMSMLSEKVKNTASDEIEKIQDSDIITMVTGGTITAGRAPCVLLGFKALQTALAQRIMEAAPPSLQVSRNMNLGEVAARWPAARAVLLDYGLHCVGCFASSYDTIDAGAKIHGMSEEEIGEMVHEMNRAITKSFERSHV